VKQIDVEVFSLPLKRFFFAPEAEKARFLALQYWIGVSAT
jgi:hypothetical protein